MLIPPGVINIGENTFSEINYENYEFEYNGKKKRKFEKSNLTRRLLINLQNSSKNEKWYITVWSFTVY